MPAREPNDKQNEDVARWLALIERGLRGNEGEQLREWLEIKANRTQILDAARLWHGPEIIAVLSGLVPQTELVVKKPEFRRRFNKILGWTTLSVAGAVGIGAMTGFVKLPFDHPNLRRENGIYSTGIGERRNVTLVDKSVVTLNTGSRMTVDYSTGSREVYLVNGEASFKVMPDPGRPFIVNAGMRRFEATGTRFNVRLISPKLTVLTVTDGSVKVMDAPPRLPETPAERRATLLYGETTVQALETAQVFAGFQSVSQLEEAEVEARLAWQRGLIVFEDVSLQDALAEVDRYTTTQFVLSDDRVRQVRIDGSFRTGDVDGLLLSLRDKFRVDSERDAQGRVVLSSRSSL